MEARTEAQSFGTNSFPGTSLVAPFGKHAGAMALPTAFHGL